MSKFNISVAVIVLATALSAAGYAAARGGGGHGGGGHGGGGHGGGGHGGGGHFHGGGHGGGHFGGGGRHFGGARHFGGRSFAQPGFRGNRSFAVRNAVSPRMATRALRNANALRNPGVRASITAGAAMAAWHGGPRGGAGWWQHGNGGYGWVGPLFWPFAYYDISDYAMWGGGYGVSFWDYGYGDIYAGIFAPYGYNDLVGYLPQYAGPQYAGRTSSRRERALRAYAAADPLAQMCGEDNGDIVGLPILQIQQAIQLNDAQRAALDDFASASVKAAQTIKSACPTEISLTAPSQLATMQQRIEAMIAGAGILQPPLQKFYDSLNDEQKALLSALVEDRRGKSDRMRGAPGPTVQGCGIAQPGLTEWPNAEIERRVHPNDAQRASLAALQDTTAKAADMLKASCQPDGAVTPPARLAAIDKRLHAMLDAVKSVRSALNEFYGTLTDEQKAQFESIGRLRMGMMDRPKAA